ncbi:MAG: HupE/UreJ family protein [bacterium]
MRRDSVQCAPIRRAGLAAALALAVVLGAPRVLDAHEIPSRVNVIAYVKPAGNTMHVVLRVPLEAMRDVEFPLRSQGFLDIGKSEPMLRQAATTWLAEYLTIYEGDAELGAPVISAIRVSLPSDRSFVTYDGALAHLHAPVLDTTVDLPWMQAMLDVSLDYRITSDRAHFSIHPALAHLGVTTSTSLRFLPPGGVERALQYVGDPGLVRLDPQWYHAARTFVRLGFTHILGGIDHLLFVLCLVIPIRRVRPLVAVITSFTVAHSITLASSALGFAPDALWFPPLIEVLVALSIVYMAFENIVGARTDRRWMLAFGFGLVHGFAFSFALRESMQFAGAHLAMGLLSFNVGVELGQLFVLAVAIPLLAFLFKRVVAERVGTILLSALIAHTAWHWMLDRGSALSEYRFQWPVLDAMFAVSVMRASMVALVAGCALWGMSVLGGRLGRSDVGVER